MRGTRTGGDAARIRPVRIGGAQPPLEAFMLTHVACGAPRPSLPHPVEP